MKPRHAAALAALILLLIAFALPWRRHPEPPEPAFGGRTLTEWALLNPAALNDNPGVLEARAAVRAIGTNALPCLLAWLSANPKRGSVRHAAELIIPDVPALASVRAWAQYDLAIIHFEVAACLFTTLGPDAAPAIPELERLASDPSGPRSAYAAVGILAGFGPQALPALQRIAANPHCPTRGHAAGEAERLVMQSDHGDSP